jgi:hypothetical protein
VLVRPKIFYVTPVRRLATLWVLAIALAVVAQRPAYGHDMAGMSMGGDADSGMSDRHMAEMGGAMALHMSYSAPRPSNPADDARAQEIVDLLRKILPRYADYHAALRDRFVPFHPEIKQQMVHFTNNRNALKAMFTFDPAAFTSLLYEPTAGGGYKLVGVMYTAPRWVSEDTLNQRVPLSVTSWHRHVNLCFPPRGSDITKVDWKQFGIRGEIATKAECKAAGGHFFLQIFGWMVHVYPMEKSKAEIWAH